MYARVTFYASKLIAPVRRGTPDALAKTAAMIRREGRRTLKVRSGTSRPGSVPHSHTLGGLRVIAYNVYTNGAIIGPVKFRSSNFLTAVPGIHEHGGISRTPKGWARYPRRPFMSVTLKRVRSRIPREFSTTLARYL